jgi:hypothetical protein
MIVVFAVLGAVGWYAGGWRALPAARLAPMMSLMIVAWIGSIVFTLRRERHAWLSFELDVEADSIVRRVEGFPELRVERGEVVRIIETRGRGLAITAGKAAPLLWIDAALDGYEQVREILDQWRPIAMKSRRDAGRVLAVLAIVAGVVAALGVAYWTEELRWFLPTGVPAIAVGIWSMIYVSRDPNVDAFTRRSVWVGVLPVLALVWKLVMLVREQGRGRMWWGPWSRRE